jgi:hypothetical protein
MTATANGTRTRYAIAAGILSPAAAAREAALVAAEIRDLRAKAKANPEHAELPMSDARRLAGIGEFFVAYVAMFERNP